MITDWDEAYSNVGHVPDAMAYPPRWRAAAQAYRDEMRAAGRLEADLAYGPAPRQRLDIFHPKGTPQGLAVFMHGGYWLRFDKSVWSHLAAGAVAVGWAVCLPSHRLAPEVRVGQISFDAGRAISFAAARVAGPVRLAGHSAGGHLAARMVTIGSPLGAALRGRIAHVLSISGVHDLRPLLRTEMNTTIGLDAAEARSESPALLEPLDGCRLTAWVGASELPEFIRQADLLANIWTGCGAATRVVHDPGRHHFSVIEALTEADAPLTAAFTGGDGWAG